MPIFGKIASILDTGHGAFSVFCECEGVDLNRIGRRVWSWNEKFAGIFWSCCKWGELALAPLSETLFLVGTFTEIESAALWKGIIFWRGADKFWVRRSICRDEKSALVQRDFPHPSAPSSSNIIVSFYGRDTQIRLPSISQLPTKIVQQASKPCRGRLRSIIVSLARFQTCLEEHADQTHKRLA